MRRPLAAAAVLVFAASAWAPPPRRPPPRPKPRPHAELARPSAAAVAEAVEAARRRSAAEAAELLRAERHALPRPDRAALLNPIAADLVRQRRADLADLRALRGDWTAVGPGAGLDPLVELELAAAEAAAERAALLRALGFVDGKEYARAAAGLAPLADSRHLPVPVARAVPGLLADLRSLAAVTALDPNGPLPPAPDVPAALKAAVARVEVAREAAKPFGGFGWPDGHAEAAVAAVEGEFGPAAAAKLRVELSAAAFLAGKADVALALLDADLDGDRGREVLADLRAAVLGDGGVTRNTQLGRLFPPGPPPVLAELVPAGRRGAWRAPTPARGETTVAGLEAEARTGLAKVRAAEVERLAGPVAAVAAAVRAELDARAGAVGPFAGKVQARLGRPVADGAEAELVAAVAARGWAVDDAVSLLAAAADAPARAARVVGAALAPAAHLAVAGRPPAALKPGPDGGFTLPASVVARDRDRVREAVRAALAAPDPAGFEAAVGRGCGLPAGEAPSPDDLAAALFDTARDLAAAHPGVAADLESLSGALDRLDGREFDDPDDEAAVRAAKVRRDELAREVSGGAAAVRAALRLLAGYGPPPAVARAWLAGQGGAPWAEAAAAVPRVPVAPVPKAAKPPVECAITLDPKADPFAEKSLTVRLRNNTPVPIELLSQLPLGVNVFLDVEVEGPAGKRVSTPFHYRVISSPFAPPPRKCGELPANGVLATELAAFASIPLAEHERLTPGAYRLRVTFQYDKYAAVSDWAAVEVKGGK